LNLAARRATEESMSFARFALVLGLLVVLPTSVSRTSANDRGTDITRLGVRTEQLAQLTARFLGEARRDADETRTRCLDRKLAEVHALLRQTWHRSESGLGSTVALDQRYATLRREVHACVGIVLREERTQATTTRTRVEMLVPSDAPTQDPTLVPASEPGATVVPPS
jgi:hypothetical protein